MPNPNPQHGFRKHPENINKKGRPPGKTNLTKALLQKITVEELAQKFIDLINKKIICPECQHEIKTCPECGHKITAPGDPSILRHIHDHIDGRPTQKQILSTETDEPFEIRITERKSESDDS